MATNNSKPTPRVNEDAERFDEITGGYDMVDHDRAAKRIMADLRKMPERVEGHTPGPWRSHGEAVWSTHESVSGPVTKGTRTNHVCAVSSRLKMPEAERAANARLIASAPDLLAACQRVHKYLNHPNDGAGRATVELCLSELSAAIARATNGGGM